MWEAEQGQRKRWRWQTQPGWGWQRPSVMGGGQAVLPRQQLVGRTPMRGGVPVDSKLLQRWTGQVLHIWPPEGAGPQPGVGGGARGSSGGQSGSQVSLIPSQEQRVSLPHPLPSLPPPSASAAEGPWPLTPGPARH